MIDVSNITNYNYSDSELEELILFWILAAGKNGKKAARDLSMMIQFLRTNQTNYTDGPFLLLKNLTPYAISEILKVCGIGCYNIKSKAIYMIVNSGIDLRNCSVDELESMFGIGMKSSRAFLLHSRPNLRYAVVDRHILHYMRNYGFDVPMNVPYAKNKYLKIEEDWLNLVPVGFTSSEYDLLIWRIFSGN